MAIFNMQSPLWPFGLPYFAAAAPIAVDPVGANFYGAGAGTYATNPLNPGYPQGSFGGMAPAGALDTSSSSPLVIGGLMVASAAVGALAVWSLGGSKLRKSARRRRSRK